MALRRCYGCMQMVEGNVCPHCGCTAEHRNLPHQLPAGTVLRGQYMVGRVLGQGGFGITYIGLDLSLDLVVAIKEFYPASAVNRDVSVSPAVMLNTADSVGHYRDNRERFLREAQALAKMHYVPEIVGVRGFFEEHNTAYIVMEFVRGTDLREYVRQHGGRIPARNLLELLEPVLKALDTVHKAGLVHRDISPDNIMILPDGSIKLLDFGAARAVDNLDADIDLSHSTEAILKHGFAPMEQYRSRGNLGPWTDEYGLCASVYYCLTGRVPPDAPARAMGDEDVDWAAVPGLQPNQRAALEKGMSMRAKDRFGDLEQLRLALYEGAAVPEAAAPIDRGRVPPVKKKSRAPLWIAAAVLAVLGAAGAWFFLGNRPEVSLEQPVPQQMPQEQTQPEQTEIPTELPAATTEAAEQPTEQPEQTQPQDSVETVAERWEKNLMRADPLDYAGLERFQIYEITFLNSTENAPSDAVDVSYHGDGSVLVWKDWSERADFRLGLVYFAADGGINGRYCCEGLFRSCINLEKIHFGGNFHSDQAESMAYMYYDCLSLKDFGTEYLDTSCVTDMQYMFAVNGNSGYSTPNLRNFDTSQVTNMSHMFADRNYIRNLDVGHWDMGNVQDISAMFKNCQNITYLDTSRWDLSAVEDMSELFSGCQKLQSVNVGSWDVSNVKDMSYAFFYCIFLEQLNVSSWDVSSVQNMSNLFFSCIRLKELKVESWDVSSVTDMTALFGKCSALTQPDVSRWEVSAVEAYEGFLDGNALINGSYWKYFFTAA